MTMQMMICIQASDNDTELVKSRIGNAKFTIGSCKKTIEKHCLSKLIADKKKTIHLTMPKCDDQMAKG